MEMQLKYVHSPQVTILNGLWKDFPQKVQKNLNEVREARGLVDVI